MIDALRKEREQLLNRLAEIQAELNRLETPSPPRVPKIGEVWIIDGQKAVMRSKHLGRDFSTWKFVCDRPHADGDFSYLCHSQYCRCSE